MTTHYWNIRNINVEGPVTIEFDGTVDYFEIDNQGSKPCLFYNRDVGGAFGQAYSTIDANLLRRFDIRTDKIKLSAVKKTYVEILEVYRKDDNFYFDKDSQSPLVIKKLGAGELVTTLVVKVEEAFQAGAVLEIGTPGDTDAFVKPEDVNLQQIGLYPITVYQTSQAVQNLILTLYANGSNTGQGYVFY